MPDPDEFVPLVGSPAARALIRAAAAAWIVLLMVIDWLLHDMPGLNQPPRPLELAKAAVMHWFTAGS